VAPASGFALAATLLRGLHVWPAILIAALVAHAPGSFAQMSMADWILLVATAAGETLEAIVGGYLINAWSGGHGTFETPARAARFTAVSLGPSAMLGATITAGVTYLVGAMAPAWSDFIDQWLTQWLRDGSGMLVVTPLLVLWAVGDVPAADRDTAPSKKWMSAIALLATGILGFLVFSPLLEFGLNRGALSILAIAPLAWAALRCSQRDSALCALVLSAFAAWGAWPENGPLGQTPEEAFLVATVIIISASVLALVLARTSRNVTSMKPSCACASAICAPCLVMPI